MPGRAMALVAALVVAAALPHATIQSTRLTAGAAGFALDGRPLQILSGEMHYPRIPREYWRDRFRKARAMGLNTVSTYVFWNLHEPAPGRYDFARGAAGTAAPTRSARRASWPGCSSAATRSTSTCFMAARRSAS